ncbi:MAG TPA: hypothetical protein P5107_01280 [Thermotogota bacterium]|nr:hypothetical protein [Thermotogota bacterium]
MSEFIIIAVTLLTLVVIVIFSVIFLKKSNKKNNEMEIDLSAFEDRVLELISKFQHISATRLTAMENKIEEMNKVLRSANEMYFKLSAVASDATKVLSKIDSMKEPILEQSELFQKKAYPNDISNILQEEIEEPVNEKESSFKDKVDHFTFEEEFINPPDLKTSSLEHKIMNLSSEGLEAIEIAKQLGIGKGEVDLVLGLFKRKYS